MMSYRVRILPVVSGETGSAARFADQWTERTKSVAVPSQGQRIYTAARVQKSEEARKQGNSP
jgi:hypothetical protein